MASAIADPDGQAFWTANFMLQESVDFRTQFYPCLRTHFRGAFGQPLPRDFDLVLRCATNVGFAHGVGDAAAAAAGAGAGEAAISAAEFDRFLKRFGPLRHAPRKALNSLFIVPAPLGGDGGSGVNTDDDGDVSLDEEPLGGPADGAVDAVNDPADAPPALVPWFHGSISREDAQGLLEQAGTDGGFLVRFTDNRPEQLVITYAKRNTSTSVGRVNTAGTAGAAAPFTFRNCLIRNEGESGYQLHGSAPIFSSVADFVRHNAAKLVSPCASSLATRYAAAASARLHARRRRRRRRLMHQSHESREGAASTTGAATVAGLNAPVADMGDGYEALETAVEGGFGDAAYCGVSSLDMRGGASSNGVLGAHGVATTAQAPGIAGFSQLGLPPPPPPSIVAGPGSGRSASGRSSGRRASFHLSIDRPFAPPSSASPCAGVGGGASVDVALSMGAVPGVMGASDVAAVDTGFGDNAYGGVGMEDVAVGNGGAAGTGTITGAQPGTSAGLGAGAGAVVIQGSVEQCIVAAEAAATGAAIAAQESADRAEISAFEALLENGTQLYRMSRHASQRAPTVTDASSASVSAAAASVAEALRVAERNALDSAVQKLEQCVKLATAAASTASMDAEQLGLEIEFQERALHNPMQAEQLMRRSFLLEQRSHRRCEQLDMFEATARSRLGNLLHASGRDLEAAEHFEMSLSRVRNVQSRVHGGASAASKALVRQLLNNLALCSHSSGNLSAALRWSSEQLMHTNKESNRQKIQARIRQYEEEQRAEQDRE